MDGDQATHALFLEMNTIRQGTRLVLRQLIQQVQAMQDRTSRAHLADTVLLYLVAAKLETAGAVNRQGRAFPCLHSVREGPPTLRVGDVVIHVTASPDGQMVRRCVENLKTNLRPIVVTAGAKLTHAERLTQLAGLGDKIDIFDIEHFVGLNLYRIGGFTAEGSIKSAMELISRYNAIVTGFETDPGLRIRVGG